MRVIAGIYRSRSIWAPEGLDTRPTSDRLRETIFNVLAPVIDGARFLDLYAGSGAVGIEALSRGAAHVTFVESNKKAVRTIRENLKALGIASGADLIEREATKALAHLAASAADGAKPFDIVFLDPPYAAEGQYDAALTALSASPLISAETIVIAEHTKHFSPNDSYAQMTVYRRMQQGDAALAFYRRAANDSAPPQ